MVTTRETRKPKADPDFEYDVDELIKRLTLEDTRADDDESFKEPTLFDTPFFEWFPRDLVPAVLSFVDDCRDLYNLSLTSNDFRNALTPEHVIRTAIFSGGNQNKAITSVMELVEQEAIHLPSTFRLLRLAIGHFCERMSNCYNYNLTGKKSAGISNSDQRPFGLCICQLCARAVGPSNVVTYHDRASAKDPRVVTYRSSLLSVSHVEYATKAPIGPRILALEFMQIVRGHQNTEDRKQALNQYFENLDEKTPKEESERLVSAFRSAASDYPAHLEANRKEKATKKRAKIEPVLSRITALLDGYQHQQLILNGEWKSNGMRQLQHRPAEAVLGPLLSAPSSASQKRIVAKVREVKNVYDTLAGQFDGASPNFLAFLQNAEGRDPIENAIYSCRLNLSLMTADVLLPTTNVLDAYTATQFVRQIQNGDRLAALVCLLNTHDLKGAFASVVVANEKRQDRKNYRKLAVRIWEDDRGSWGWRHDLVKYRAKYQRCHTEYVELAEKLKFYLTLKKTKEFLAETRPPPGKPNQVFTRADATKGLFDLPGRTKDFLKESRFNAVRNVHKNLFLNH